MNISGYKISIFKKIITSYNYNELAEKGMKNPVPFTTGKKI
jgi:hypothetical protein